LGEEGKRKGKGQGKSREAAGRGGGHLEQQRLGGEELKPTFKVSINGSNQDCAKGRERELRHSTRYYHW